MSFVGRTLIPAPHGQLEAIYRPSSDAAERVALALHPHPLYGGTMHNKVVYHTAKALEAATSGGKAGVEADKAVTQLTSTMEKLKELGLAGDVDRLEILMPRGAPFKNNDLGIKDGYLIKWSTGKPVEIPKFGA